MLAEAGLADGDRWRELMGNHDFFNLAPAFGSNSGVKPVSRECLKYTLLLDTAY